MTFSLTLPRTERPGPAGGEERDEPPPIAKSARSPPAPKSLPVARRAKPEPRAKTKRCGRSTTRMAALDRRRRGSGVLAARRPAAVLPRRESEDHLRLLLLHRDTRSDLLSWRRRRLARARRHRTLSQFRQRDKPFTSPSWPTWTSCRTCSKKTCLRYHLAPSNVARFCSSRA